MKKVVIDQPGSYEQLNIQEGATPSPAADEVLIDVKAIGVNFADCCVRMGVYASAKKYVGWPITPGFEVSGVVRETGKNVQQFKPGQKIMALTRFGGYATALSVPQNQVFPLPHDWDFSEGGGFPTIFLTAYYALFELAHPHKGDRILIHSAAGGVGSALVELCRLAGCRSIGVVGRPEKVSETNADFIIDKSTQNLWKQVENICPDGCDVILDANGVETLKESYRHLSPGGKLVVYGFHTMLSKSRGTPNWVKVAWDYLRTPRFNPLYMTSDNHSILAFNLSFLFDRNERLQEAMQSLLSWAEEEKITLPKVTTVPFDKVSEAHKLIESGKSTGKIVLMT